VNKYAATFSDPFNGLLDVKHSMVRPAAAFVAAAFVQGPFAVLHLNAT
jgi:hypothetical protein